MTTPGRGQSRSRRSVLKESILFYLQYILISFAVIVFVLALCKVLNIEIQNVNSLKGDQSEDILHSIALMAFVGPCVEEVIFRLWHSFRREHIMLSMFVIAYTLLTKCLPHSHDVFIGSVQSDFFELPVLKTSLSLVLAASCFLVNTEWLHGFTSKYGRAMIISSIIIFALLHLTNIRCAWYLYPFLVCMCLPQFILGVSATNLRLNVGFWAGLAFHCAVNLVTILIQNLF